MVLAFFSKRLLLGILLSYVLFTCGYASAGEYIAPPSLSHIENNDIKRLLPNDEIKTLLADEKEFLSLYSEYMSADYKGIVLLIPDWQSSPTNNAGMNFLRKELNYLGYTTYTMTVPDIDWQASNEDKEASDAPPSTQTSSANSTTTSTDSDTDTQSVTAPNHVDAIEKVNDEVINNYKSNLLTRYKALYQSAMQTPSNIVVIAQGASAGVLIEYYGDFPAQQLDAFISLSSYLPNAKRNKALSQTTSIITPALLDIYYEGDNQAILLSVKNRQRWVNRNAKFDYRQRQLFGQRDQPQQHARLTKEIDGFLRRLF